MSVTLLFAYGGYAVGAVVTLPDSTESALIAQGLATASTTSAMPDISGGPDQTVTIGGNIGSAVQAGQSTPTYRQGPLILPNIPLGSAALTGYETNGVAQTAGTFNIAEIYIPHWNTWAGVGWLNGTIVGTNKIVGALYGTNGALLANTAVAGTTTAGASVMQNAAFVTPVTLPPGRYFIGIQADGNTDTLRHILAANGANVMTTSVAGTFGTVPATITVPATFTTAVGPIAQLYT